jgi:hypothetical protein
MKACQAKWMVDGRPEVPENENWWTENLEEREEKGKGENAEKKARRGDETTGWGERRAKGNVLLAANGKIKREQHLGSRWSAEDWNW